MTVIHYQPDPARGCGRKREGFYLEGAMGVGGSLASWTWLLGTHVDGGINCLTNIPPRQMEIGNLRASLIAGEFIAGIPLLGVLGGEESLSLYDALGGAMPHAALFDHVGKKHYTPWSFAEETIYLGPSRRVPAITAKNVASLLADAPVPIVFVYKMPLVGIEERDALMELAAGAVHEYGEKRWTQPTWLQPGFSLYARDPRRENGEEHWLAGLLYLESLHAEGALTGERHEIARRLFDEAPRFQMPFGVSWINRVSHARPPGDDSDDDALWRMGIETIVLDE